MVEFLENEEETGTRPIAIDGIPCFPKSHLPISSPDPEPPTPAPGRYQAEISFREWIMIVLNLFSFSLVIGLQIDKRPSSTSKIQGEIYRVLPFLNKEGAWQGQNLCLCPFFLAGMPVREHDTWSFASQLWTLGWQISEWKANTQRMVEQKNERVWALEGTFELLNYPEATHPFRPLWDQQLSHGWLFFSSCSNSC